VIEIKYPNELSALDNPSFVGQVCDYMLDAQSFYGHEDLFTKWSNGSSAGSRKAIREPQPASSQPPYPLLLMLMRKWLLSVCSTLAGNATTERQI
jgi:hypothetical protein